jgi:hypothetical protein
MTFQNLRPSSVLGRSGSRKTSWHGLGVRHSLDRDATSRPPGRSDAKSCEARLCKPEVTGSIPVRSIAYSCGRSASGRSLSIGLARPLSGSTPLSMRRCSSLTRWFLSGQSPTRIGSGRGACRNAGSGTRCERSPRVKTLVAVNLTERARRRLQARRLPAARACSRRTGLDRTGASTGRNPLGRGRR